MCNGDSFSLGRWDTPGDDGGDGHTMMWPHNGHRTVHLKIVERVNFRFCLFYHSKEIRKKNHEAVVLVWVQ